MSSRSGSAKGFIQRNISAITMGLTALVIAGTADLFAGILQDQMTGYLFTGMMILIYSAIGMRGNIFGAMGSRIGTAMNIGTFEMSAKKGTVLRANVESTILLTLIMSIAMGVTTWIASCIIYPDATDIMSIWDFIFISTVGGVIAGIIVLMFNILIAYIGNKREWDVDNITAPLIAAIGDIVTMPMIFAATWLMLEIGDVPDMGDMIILAISLALIALTVFFTLYIVKRKVSKRDFSGEAKRVVFQSLPVLMFCLVFEIGAGITIQSEQDKLVEFSVLLIMLPAFLNQGNALSGMLTSRLSSMIHLGTLEDKWVPGRGAYENFLIMYICAMLTFLYIGLISFGAAWVTSGNDNIGILTSLGIILVAGFLATTILNILSYYVAIAATKFGLDPDDCCIPITSSVMDMLGSMVLVFIIYLFI
ncbi:MAG: magnesium transporter [archaeon]|nr:magnesium transporter [archaeon]